MLTAPRHPLHPIPGTCSVAFPGTEQGWPAGSFPFSWPLGLFGIWVWHSPSFGLEGHPWTSQRWQISHPAQALASSQHSWMKSILSTMSILSIMSVMSILSHWPRERLCYLNFPPPPFSVLCKCKSRGGKGVRDVTSETMSFQLPPSWRFPPHSSLGGAPLDLPPPLQHRTGAVGKSKQPPAQPTLEVFILGTNSATQLAHCKRMTLPLCIKKIDKCFT